MRAKLIWPTEPLATPRGAIPFYGLSLAVGIALLIPLLLLPLYRTWMARSWRVVPRTILTSGVQSKSELRGGTTFKIGITYSYAVNGREYTGHRYDFFSVATAGYRSKAAVAREYAPGTQHHCLVNPDDPAEAVLARHLGTPFWIGLLPLTFVVAGALGIIHTVRQGRPRPTG
jgi:hypothetical protein